MTLPARMFHDGYRRLTDATQIGGAIAANPQLCGRSVDRLVCFGAGVSGGRRRRRRAEQRIGSTRGGRRLGCGARRMRNRGRAIRAGLQARSFDERRRLPHVRWDQHRCGAGRRCTSAIVRYSRRILRAWSAQDPHSEQRDEHANSSSHQPAERNRSASHWRPRGPRGR